MVVEEVKQLHLYPDFDTLKGQAHIEDKKMTLKYRHGYFSMLDKCDLKIKEARMCHDQELEYFFIYRFVQIFTKMVNTPENKSNKEAMTKNTKYLKKYKNLISTYMDTLEKLDATLKKRYSELKAINQRSESLSSDRALFDNDGMDERNHVDNKTPSPASTCTGVEGYMSCKQLFSLISDKNLASNHLLIVDCRSKQHFASCHISYKHSVNIPYPDIQRGISGHLLQYSINNKDELALWKNRFLYEYVVLLDYDTNQANNNESHKVSILYEILDKWDVKGTYKNLVTLDGGFTEFQSMYPHSTSNPYYNPEKDGLITPATKQPDLNKLTYPEISRDIWSYEVKVNPPPSNEKVEEVLFSALKKFLDEESLKKKKGEPAQDHKQTVTIQEDRQPVEDRQPETERGEVSMEVDDQVENSLRDPTILNSFIEREGDVSGKSILKVNQSTDRALMNEEEKAAFVDNIRKLKPTQNDSVASQPPVSSPQHRAVDAGPRQPTVTSIPPEPRSGGNERMDASASSSEDEETFRTSLKLDGGGSGMRRSLSSPNIAKAKDDDMVPSFTRSNKPVSSSTRQFFTPFSHGENMDAIHGKTQVGLTGLKNYANNCYMNSILQCLSNTEALCTQLVKIHRPSLNPNSTTKGEIANSFISALKYIWSGDYKVYSIRELKNLMGSYKEIFRGSNHQDSHEFLIILLEYLHDDLNNPMKNTVLDGASESSGEKAWGLFRQKNQSIIQQLFYGQEQSSVTCRTCGHRSVTFDHFFNLSVPIPDSDRTSIEDCIRVYLSGETITWRCPHCKVDRSAVKKLDITRLPPILIIALKRFSQEGLSSWLEKKETLVTYPLENLNMSGFTLPGSEQRNTRYNLHALSLHMGSLRSGHYRAICQNHVTTKWYLFDDTNIRPISVPEVKNNQEVYILFYHAVG